MAHYKGAASEGTRAQNLLKKREKAKEEFESLRKKIEDVSCSRYVRILSSSRMCSILRSSSPQICATSVMTIHVFMFVHIHSVSVCRSILYVS